MVVITPPESITIVPCLDSPDVLLLPAVWPVRLDPIGRRRFAHRLLALDDDTGD
ncbi:hypothetical protein [Nonomuraea typhae]|uniref:hypothetical protein n=1 Tax=Nonomuraea typhae TaxID=2603600 RepID=UPI0012F738F7|nr:hypothetical protein [Nonomuraea typhae]